MLSSSLFLKHGYSILVAAVFVHQLGLPVPGPLFLLAAGALAAARRLGLVPALGLAVSACVIADWAWYEAGRRWGEGFALHSSPRARS
jgi:membrane protein DedA with SNARE-associated domain